MSQHRSQRAQLLAVVPGGDPADGHRGGRPAARRRPGALRRVAGPVPRPRLHDSRWPRGRSRSPRPRGHRGRRPCDGYRRQRMVFDTEDTMSVPAYLLVPDGRQAPGSAVLAVHGHGPGKSRVCGLEPDDPPGGDYAAELARRGHVVLAPDLRCFGERADWNPRRPLRLRHQPGPPGDGRMEPADPEPVGPGPRPRRAGGPPAGRPGPDGRGRLLLRGHDDAVPGRHRRPGGRRRGQRLLLVVGRVAQGALEHVRLPGALRACSAGWSTSTSAPWSPPVPSWSRPGATTCSSRWPPPRSRLARLRPVYDHVGAGDRLVHDVFEGEHQWHGERAYPFLDLARAVGPVGGPGRTGRPSGSSGGQPAVEEQPAGVGVEEDGGVRGPLQDRGRARRRHRALEGGPHRLGLAGLGHHGQDPAARSRAGMVTVTACRGTSASLGKCPSLTCWRRQPASSSPP